MPDCLLILYRDLNKPYFDERFEELLFNFKDSLNNSADFSYYFN